MFLHPTVTPNSVDHVSHFFERQSVCISVNSIPFLGSLNGLEVPLFPLLPLSLALANNALADPFSLEAIIQLLKIVDHVCAGFHNSLLGGNGAVGLNTELKRGEERVGNLVGSEHNGRVLEEALGEQIAERVVFLVEGENGCVGDACCAVELARGLRGMRAMSEGLLTGLRLLLNLLLTVV
jgi:hypothetical protein